MRTPTMTLLAASLLSLATLAACGDDAAKSAAAPKCNAKLRPVVMVHGFLASADTWTSFAQRFEANGYCPELLFALDWNTLTGREAAFDALTALIDKALAASGDDEINLIGHSAGGGLGYDYLSDAARASKVATYVHIASPPDPLAGVAAGPAGPPEAPVPTLNLTSTADEIIASSEIPGAINLVLTSEDHYQSATSVKAFDDVYTFLNFGKHPTTTEIADGHPFDDALPRVVSGKALTIGENVPVAGWTVAVYEVEAATGKRRDEAAEATFTVAADGSWGPFDAEPETYYELFLSGPGPTDRAVHYYREPFVASDRFVRLRALPAPGTLVAALFAVIPFNPESTVLIAFTESQATISGRDTLTIAGETISTAQFASADRTAIAFFLFDEKADKQPGGIVQSFDDITNRFLSGIDRFLPAGDHPITLTFNGRTLVVPSWPSDPDGAVVATFD